VTKESLKLGLNDFKKNFGINYKNVYDFFTLKWEANTGFFIDLIKSSKDKRDKVYNNLE